jgi:3-dehydroquinate dehydratase-2
MLGVREPEIYGTQKLEDIRRLCDECALSLSLKADFRQSNHEGQLIDWIQETVSSDVVGLIINPAGLGHSSVALMDALLALKIPSIEVHLTNTYKREDFRRHTYTSRATNGAIAGFGSYGYLLAIYALNDIIKNAQKSA